MTTPRSQRLMELREQAQRAMSRMEPSAVQQAFEAMDLPHLIEELRIYHEELEIQNEELAVAHTKSDAARSRYQLLFSLLPMPALLLESFGVIVEDNDASQDWLGPPRRYQHHDLRLNQAISREDRPRVNRMLSLLEPLQKGSLSNLSLTGFDQGKRQVDLHAARLPQDFHQEARYLVVLLDRSAEKARLAEHGVFNALLDSSDDLVFATDPYGRLMLANQTFLGKLGLSRDRALGRKLSELLPPSAAALDFVHNADTSARLPDQAYVSVRWPSATSPSRLALQRFSIRNRQQTLIGFASTCRDSEREQQVASAEDLAHRALIELPVPALICGQQGQIAVANQAFQDQTGFSADALQDRHLDRLFPPQDPESDAGSIWSGLLANGGWEGARSLRCADGRAWSPTLRVKRLLPRSGDGSQHAVWLFL